jgi:hypothetical protein
VIDFKLHQAINAPATDTPIGDNTIVVTGRKACYLKAMIAQISDRTNLKRVFVTRSITQFENGNVQVFRSPEDDLRLTNLLVISIAQAYHLLEHLTGMIIGLQGQIDHVGTG